MGAEVRRRGMKGMLGTEFFGAMGDRAGGGGTLPTQLREMTSAGSSAAPSQVSIDGAEGGEVVELNSGNGYAAEFTWALPARASRYSYMVWAHATLGDGGILGIVTASGRKSRTPAASGSEIMNTPPFPGKANGGSTVTFIVSANGGPVTATVEWAASPIG